MAPIETRHAECVSRLARLFIRRTSATVRVQDPIRLGETSAPQPDLVVARAKSYAHPHPEPADILLLIEVADTSFDYDWDIKLPLYARHGIPEVWLVDLNGNQVQIHRDPSPSGYTRIQNFAAEDSLEPESLPGIRVAVGDILPGA